ncbi:MAG: ferrous iron transport protein B [Peptoniphilaceae bacterium]|nr:ferrous iron transport protein B [Peptoniphilaceae bacterium]
MLEMVKILKLNELKQGDNARIISVGGKGALRQHLLDMGVIPGVGVTLVQFAPMGDPIEIRIHGYELTLRLADAAKIGVQKVEGRLQMLERSPGHRGDVGHPGFGEYGKAHDKKTEHPLPPNTLLTFALVGNQNSGKTTLFNQLTGSNQHVGNFPGITVDRKDGMIRGRTNTRVTDLPGIYSMTAYSNEELVSRNFVLREKPKAIINIVDATNLERNLYLTIQLLEMDVPMVIALNMMDEVTGNSGAVDVNLMEKMLGVPVVPISAAKNQGIEELIDHAIHVAQFQERPLVQDFCDQQDHGGAVHRSLHATMHLIEQKAQQSELPIRFAASKLMEGDEKIIRQLALTPQEKSTADAIARQMEEERGLDRSAAMADMRFHFLYRVTDQVLTRPKKSKEQERSRKLDQWFTGKWTAIPIFVLIMASIFWLTFNVIGAGLQSLFRMGIDALAQKTGEAFSAWGVNPVLRGLVADGIFAGVGSVVSFLPIIVTLFFFLSILEDSGYIARVAFFMDKLFRRLGLSGRSIVPLLIGFGCTVPAVMSTRTLPSKRDRTLTILLTPFMSCSAKLPIYAFLVQAFFPKKGGLIMTGLYLLGIVLAILIALVFKSSLFRGEAVPFVMELPNYRMPTPKNVLRLLWDKSRDFIQRAFSIILIATMIVWFLQHYTWSLQYTSQENSSILAQLASLLVPVFVPLGLGDWRIITSLIAGFMAKESVVSTMEMLLGSQLTAVLTPATAASLLVFSLIYTPCVAAIASIRRELGGWWAAGVVVWQTLLAWICAFAVRWIVF